MSLDELSPYLVHKSSQTDKWLSPSGRTYEYYDNALTDCEVVSLFIDLKHVS